MAFEKSHVFGWPVLIIALLVHFISFAAIYGWKVGLVNGLIAAVGNIILAIILVITYTALTKNAESASTFMKLTIYTLTVVILANFFSNIYTRYMASAITSVIGLP